MAPGQRLPTGWAEPAEALGGRGGGRGGARGGGGPGPPRQAFDDENVAEEDCTWRVEESFLALLNL